MAGGGCISKVRKREDVPGAALAFSKNACEHSAYAPPGDLPHIGLNIFPPSSGAGCISEHTVKFL